MFTDDMKPINSVREIINHSNQIRNWISGAAQTV